MKVKALVCDVPISIFRKIVRPLSEAYMYIFVSRLAIRNLKRRLDNCGKDFSILVDLAFNFEYKQRFRKSWIVEMNLYQVKSEIDDFFGVVQGIDPKIIVEIGTASGGTLFLFANATSPEKIVSIDLPQGSFGGGYPFWKIPFYKSLGQNHVIKLIRADSHINKTLEELRVDLKGRQVDILFIDGDHTYQGVAKDFQMYSPLVKKGGIVAFHDIVMHDKTSGCEVHKFWNEIKKSYEHREIIENPHQEWAGIGVLFF